MPRRRLSSSRTSAAAIFAAARQHPPAPLGVARERRHLEAGVDERARHGLAQHAGRADDGDAPRRAGLLSRKLPLRSHRARALRSHHQSSSAMAVVTAFAADPAQGSGGIGNERRLTNHKSVSSRFPPEHQVANDAAVHVGHGHAVPGAADRIDRAAAVRACRPAGWNPTSRRRPRPSDARCGCPGAPETSWR